AHPRRCPGQLVPDELIRFWHGHAGKTVTVGYSKLKYDVEFRKQVAKNVGVAFELPSEKAVIELNGPNRPKLEVAAVEEFAVNY
ncbi:MAG: hypothetical protein ACREQ5_11040, partial [Candidatus Dormibacteria bacterium]